jgi:FeS assembly protein IscX
MGLKWTDTREIAICLSEKYPDADPQLINFKELYDWTLALEEFDDNPKRCGEKILEAIQMVWIEEKN